MNLENIFSKEYLEKLEGVMDDIEYLLDDESIYEEHVHEDTSDQDKITHRAIYITMILLHIIFSIMSLLVTNGIFRFCYAAKAIAVTFSFLAKIIISFMQHHEDYNQR